MTPELTSPRAGMITARSAPPDAFRTLVHVASAPPAFALTRALRRLARRRPGIFERLGRYDRAIFALEPTDVPVRFLMWPRARQGEVRIVCRGEGPHADATVRGPMRMLIETALGRRDADSDMFSRALTITGDTAALVALRNTIEASDLRWPDLLGVPLGVPHALEALYARLTALSARAPRPF